MPYLAGMNATPLIQANSIQKSFGKLQVLKGLDIQVYQGQIISIVGPSGAGKTTLLQILGTLERPDQGSVLFRDKAIEKLDDRQLSDFRNRNIGFIFQFHQLLPEFTARENVIMPALIAGAPMRESKQRADELLKRLELGHRLDAKPATLSGGEQQRVAVARALMNKPSLILADEPSGNLDSSNAKALHELFFRLRDESRQTFIIVTHNQELAEMADRKITMVDGKIINPE